MRSLLETRLPYEQARDQAGVAESQFREVPTFNNDARTFRKGQWIDAKDTIDQWVSLNS